MCLLLTESTKRHIVTEDLVVYKVLIQRSNSEGQSYDFAESPFYHMEYSLGRCYRSSLDEYQPDRGMMVDLGNGVEYKVGLGLVSRGLHGYTTLEGARKSLLQTDRWWYRVKNEVPGIYKARVPAGSEIYFGIFEDGQESFAASQLIVDEFVENL